MNLIQKWRQYAVNYRAKAAKIYKNQGETELALLTEVRAEVLEFCADELEKNGLVLIDESHPEANGKVPNEGDHAWKVDIPLEDGTILHLELGKKGRDCLFGMLIADCQDSGEKEPETRKCN